MTTQELDQLFATLREVNRDQNSLASDAIGGDTEALLNRLVALSINTNRTLLGIYCELVHARQAANQK
jgi:hypothetical protein